MASELEQLVERLRRENAELLAENDRLRQQVKELLARVAELERAAARQAGPFRRDEQKKISADQQKKPGRKPGHLGCYRRPPLKVDEQIEVLLSN